MSIAHRVLAGFCLAMLFSTLSVAQAPSGDTDITLLNVNESLTGEAGLCAAKL